MIFSNKKLKKIYPDLKFISHFIRNISDLKLKMLFLIYGTLLYRENRFVYGYVTQPTVIQNAKIKEKNTKYRKNQIWSKLLS